MKNKKVLFTNLRNNSRFGSFREPVNTIKPKNNFNMNDTPNIEDFETGNFSKLISKIATHEQDNFVEIEFNKSDGYNPQESFYWMKTLLDKILQVNLISQLTMTYQKKMPK